MLMIVALKRLREKKLESEPSLGYMHRKTCLRNPKWNNYCHQGSGNTTEEGVGRMLRDGMGSWAAKKIQKNTKQKYKKNVFRI